MKPLDSAKHLGGPEAIIFDWDNTLVDSWPLIHEAISNALQFFGYMPGTLEDTKMLVHNKDALRKNFPDNWEEIAKTYRNHYTEIQHRLVPLKFAEHTLEILKTKKIPTCLVSNKKNYLIHTEITKFGWEKYFACVVGSGDVESDKPSGLGVEFVLSKIGRSTNSKIWFVGDSIIDMQTAYNTGCLPVFFGEDDYQDDIYKDCRPKLHFLNHKFLSEYLSAI